MNSKEFGSDFDFLINEDFLLKNSNDSCFNNSKISLFFSGRAALFHLIKNGIKNNNWQRVYLPSFYCHEVTNYIECLNVTIEYYDFNPFIDSEDKQIQIEDSERNIIINVSFFGMVKLNLKHLKKAVIIDDYTHDLLRIKESSAHYCFGSLRKELPIPVGGFCYSPRNLKLPIEYSNAFSEVVAVQKLTAMYLKSLFLNNKISEKELYRSLFANAEEIFENQNTNVGLPEVAKAILFKLDLEKIIFQKRKNFSSALEIINSIPQVFQSKQKNSNSEFGLVLLCDNEKQKQGLRTYLIENAIFPATLWPNQFLDVDINTEKRMLFVHLDYRYNEQESINIAIKIKCFFENE
jgi:hypothetical protein